LKEAWPRAELVIVDDAGHGSGLDGAIVEATRRFSER